ncbi:MAG TPA: aminoglycoside phosphotransferase family protein, partial [Actinopolymorphaceae bacterium]|nr:aminoglycoside phosphotransferase family protein [Actinopolymorphaceae bacterium]
MSGTRDGSVLVEMPPFPRTPSLESLLTAIAAECRQVDLTDAVLRSGWENVVVETRDGWIVRFPRPGVDFEREMAVLRVLQQRLPVPIPQVEWTGRLSRCAAYRKLTGSSFDATAYVSAPDAQRDSLAASLADFLARMHTSLTPAEIEQLELPRPVRSWDVTRIVAELGRVPADARPQIERLLDAVSTVAAATGGPPVVLHNDFNSSNLVFSGPVGRLTGVWDFSCVEVGEPALDLRYFEGDSID